MSGDVPILDDAYMAQRRRVAFMESYADNLRRIQRYGVARDTPESLRDEYAAGKIGYDELHSRLDAVFGLGEQP